MSVVTCDICDVTFDDTNSKNTRDGKPICKDCYMNGGQNHKINPINPYMTLNFDRLNTALNSAKIDIPPLGSKVNDIAYGERLRRLEDIVKVSIADELHKSLFNSTQVTHSQDSDREANAKRLYELQRENFQLMSKISSYEIRHKQLEKDNAFMHGRIVSLESSVRVKNNRITELEGELLRARRQPPPTRLDSFTAFIKDNMKFIIASVHPDKHGNSEQSNLVLRKFLEIRKAINGT